jgi:hypothetical protein
LNHEKQSRDGKGRFLPKEIPKKYRLRVNNDEKRLIESLRTDQIDIKSLLEKKYPKETLTTPMRLLPNILLRAGTNFESLIVETVRGENVLDSNQLNNVILELKKILETMEHLDSIRDIISAALEREEDQVAVQQRLRPVQQVLHALKFMNRLDEVILLSLEDPDFLVCTSEGDFNEIQPIITLLDKSKSLRLISGAKSEITRLGPMMVYKSKVPPHYLLVLISSDPKAMLETRKLHEIEGTIRLVSNQLETMLKSVQVNQFRFNK